MKFNLSEATGSVQAMVNGFIERLPYFAIAVVVFIIFLFIGKGIRATVRAITQRNRRHYNLGLVMGRLSYGVIIFIGLLIALVIAIPGFTPGELVNILGLSSVAIGFAFRDILQNFLAGILLLLAEPFRIGDQIILNDFEGTVEDIQTRATFIKTYDGRRVVIPNSNLFTNAVTVNTAYKKRRLQYDISIGYGDDIVRAKRILLDTVREIPEVLDDPPPDALVVALADSSVNIRLRWWVQPPRRFESLNAQDVVLEKVVNALLSEGFDLPFPTQQILFHDQTEETDGDRSRQREGWPQGKSQAPRPARIVDALRGLKKAHSEEQNAKPHETTTDQNP
ncbi:mechanosensitive ion channel family protein [Methylobacter luteus]|uniref:mechanosensitive ion channel family protein n=1 Tax=Methylobacter luteus TaxID=415 RepID=UPI00047F0960|nr:mechanosensitive ion channel family protein [Methylobacter luteus]